MNFTYHTVVDYPRWIACFYNGKPRVGLDLGDDQRPGTRNRVVITLDGIRTFKTAQMFDLRDVTTIVP